MGTSSLHILMYSPALSDKELVSYTILFLSQGEGGVFSTLCISSLIFPFLTSPGVSNGRESHTHYSGSYAVFGTRYTDTSLCKLYRKHDFTAPIIRNSDTNTYYYIYLNYFLRVVKQVLELKMYKENFIFLFAS